MKSGIPVYLFAFNIVASGVFIKSPEAGATGKLAVATRFFWDLHRPPDSLERKEKSRTGDCRCVFYRGEGGWSSCKVGKWQHLQYNL